MTATAVCGLAPPPISGDPPGFITTPSVTLGRMPLWRLRNRPCPGFWFELSERLRPRRPLPMHSWRTMRSSLEESRIWIVATVAAHELGVGAGGAGNLATLAGFHLDVVDNRLPIGRPENGIALPGFTSALAEATT